MNFKTADIFISGAGLAGLITSIALGQAGFTVICADPEQASGPTTRDADLRTTAYFMPNVEFLETLGIWDAVKNNAAALEVMRIVDASTDHLVTKDFVSRTVSDSPFGFNVANWTMRHALESIIADLPNVTCLHGVRTERIFTRTNQANVKLSDGSKITTKLVIGADGRNSFVRETMGIGTNRTEFDQTAITFAATHQVPHENISTEVHRSGGPFTFVPLPDYEGLPCSAVVWMDTNDKAQGRLSLTNDEFQSAATRRSANVLGPLRLITKRMAWPMVSMMADDLVGERCVLIAEAAHVLPPIGAQGLNLSLRDIKCLVETCKNYPDDPGKFSELAKFERQRLNDIRARVIGVSALNRISMFENPILQNLRGTGLNALHSIPPLRNIAMRTGLGGI